MTLHIADIASYQGKLTVAQLAAAGFRGINVKVSHGLGQQSVHTEAARYVREAREAGFALSSFHWLTADAGGTAQADHAFRCMGELGLIGPGVAHVVDVESDGLTQRIYRDYVLRMWALLERSICTYSGKWWANTRTWVRPSAESPWLWSAPGRGYQPAYPGDASPLWEDGYGGWFELAVMQYRVARIGGIKVSQSAVRDPNLWADMAGVRIEMAAWTLVPSLTDLRQEFNALSPKRDKGADGSIGDSSHTSSSDHTPDEDSRVLKDHDGDNKNEVHALDIDSSGPWSGEGTQKQRFHRIFMRIIDGERAKWKDDKDKCRLNYAIWDRKIYDKDNDFEPRDYTGSDPHTNHAHFSNRYETQCENDTRPWGVLTVQPPAPAPAKPVEEPDVAFQDEKIKVTATMGKELFEPDLAAGTEVNAATVIQLAAIHARRAALATDTLEERADKVDADIEEIKSSLAEIKALLAEDDSSV